MQVRVASVGGCAAPAHHTKAPSLRLCLSVWCSPHDLCYRLPGRRKAMKGRLYFTTKAQKEGKIMIKTHPCARIFCCRFCGFDEVGDCGQGCRQHTCTTGKAEHGSLPLPQPRAQHSPGCSHRWMLSSITGSWRRSSQMSSMRSATASHSSGLIWPSSPSRTSG